MIRDNFSIKVNGHILDLSEPCVMSIINITPDSFWHESRVESDDDIVRSVDIALSEGASILDIGGFSSRPGAADVSVDEEIRRVKGALSTIKREFSDLKIPISIDTFRADVIKVALDICGEVIVNDISSGEDDLEMLNLVSTEKLPYIAMHKRGTPRTMGSHADYGDVVVDIIDYFVTKTALLKSMGIDDVILDMGFGFAKNREQNFELIRRYSEFSIMGYPTLAGISRKRMVWDSLGVDVSESLNGTSILNWELLRAGSSILRVHDTKAAVEAVKLYKMIYLNR